MIKLLCKTLLVLLLVATSVLYSYSQNNSDIDAILNELVNRNRTFDAFEKGQQFIFSELVDLNHDTLVDLTFESLTTSKSKDFKTFFYHSDDLNIKGLIFAFWSDHYTEESIQYDGHGFKVFDLSNTKNVITRLTQILDQKYSKLREANIAVFQYEDVTFSFRSNNDIHIFWNGFSTKWHKTNLKSFLKKARKKFDEKTK